MIKKCENCSELILDCHYQKRFCNDCYKERRILSRKKYRSKPETKIKEKQWKKNYLSKPEAIANKKQYMKNYIYNGIGNPFLKIILVDSLINLEGGLILHRQIQPYIYEDSREIYKGNL